jgi:hypothetical protein
VLAEITIGARFNGPPSSANGGYAAGRLASFVDAPAVTVRLSAPPPLDTAMAVFETADGVELRHGDTVVASARPAELALEPPVRLAVETAAAAEAGAAWVEAVHPYPTCFGCGPLRERGDALRHMCGPAGGDVVACRATTDASLPHDDDGALRREIVWAALDCPSAVPVIRVGGPPHLLGTFTVRIDAPVRVGEDYACVAWPLGAEGRKKRAGSALLDATGRVCAVAEAVWIEVRR